MNTLLKFLKNLLLTTKLPHSKAQKLTFKENGTISLLYDNLNFSYKNWITKFENKIDPNLYLCDSLKTYSFDINNLTNIINHLNSAIFRINSSHFLEFKKAIESSACFKKILQYRACTKTTKLIHTVLDDNLEATSDKSFVLDTLNIKNINDYLEYNLIISQLTRILKYSSGIFFLKYVLDGRSRIYVYQWPINYQLNHFVRNIIDLTQVDDVWSTYKSFFASSEYIEYKKIYKLWKIRSIDYTKVQKLLHNHGLNIKLA